MMRVFWIVFGLIALVLSACAQAPDWRLVEANKLRADTYLILTVPQDDPVALAAIAAEIAADFDVPLAAEWPLNSIGVHCLVYDATDAADVEALIAAMEADARIRTAQRIQDFTTSAVTYPDPLFRLQTALEQMNAPEAHLVSRGAGIRVGVIDSAIDRTHTDLRDRVVDARDFVATAPAALAEAHGTAVAGVIAASAENAAGMVGVAPEADLVGLRACWQAPGQSGRCNTFSLARAINFAILNDIDVLNLSLGGPDDPLLRELLAQALARNMVVVAASGESARDVFPASLPGVIAAGRGSAGRIPAPTQDVITTAPGDKHGFASGSSIATAHVSGVVALMLAQNPGLTNAGVNDRLTRAVGNKDGARMLDACVAMASPVSSSGICAP
ncbi:S8 family serine peptidase [Yoonia sp. SS1-5]|uniref:S8 family serine peptidase n=1 Tax=Yoonia rhodophyticola TaxID=3137370 RepID=A0AAN0NKC5_9RHOB